MVNPSTVRNASVYCVIAPLLVEAASNLADRETDPDKLTVEAGGNTIAASSNLIDEAGSYLDEHPCKYVQDGICPLAQFLVNKVASQL